MQAERGVALITVMLILVLLTTLAAYLAEEDFISIRRASNALEYEQAYQLARGSEDWTLLLLKRDAQESEYDHLNEAWNQLGPPVKVEQGELATAVTDEQGKFNLNNLQAGQDTTWYPAFQRLLAVLGLDIGLAEAVVDWIDADPNPLGPNGAEDQDYLLLTPPYRAANRPLQDISELLRIRGFDQEKLAILAPYVTALPTGNATININTCSAVILSILPQAPLSDAQAAAIVNARGELGFEKIDDLLVLPEFAGQGETLARMIGVNSQYFSVKSTGTIGRAKVVLQSLIGRNPESGESGIVSRHREVS
jgi:general secretion pathway protein K